MENQLKDFFQKQIEEVNNVYFYTKNYVLEQNNQYLKLKKDNMSIILRNDIVLDEVKSQKDIKPF